MDKKLPKVYANNIDRSIENNKKVFYSAKELEQKEERNSKTNGFQEKNVSQKINEIFNSPKYVYKIKVEITRRNGTEIKQIVGKNAMNLITMENELIPISDILDISLAES